MGESSAYIMTEEPGEQVELGLKLEY